MKSNILSLGQVLEKGYDIHMKYCSLFIRDDKGNLIMKVKTSKCRIFSLNIQNDIAKCLKTYYKNAPWLWYLRFGHLNFGGLELLSKKNIVKGLPCINYPNQIFEVFEAIQEKLSKRVKLKSKKTAQAHSRRCLWSN